MARIALKVDVDTLRGTQVGVPKLLRLFERHGVTATFLFSLGPDHTGWALRRVFRAGFLSKVGRTSVVKHYGLRTLSYGVLLPAPDIGRRAAEPMRACLAAGHECGIHSWDHVLWHDGVRRQDAAWTQRQLDLAYTRYVDVMGLPPDTFGAAGWQTNHAAWRRLDSWGMSYASDGRGAGPYRPTVDGRALHHVQWPTTLPTFDELIGRRGVDGNDVHQPVLARTEGGRDQVFTLHAELEGGLLEPAFVRLLHGLRRQGHVLGTLGQLHRSTDLSGLPARPLAWGTVDGRSGELVMDCPPTAA